MSKDNYRYYEQAMNALLTNVAVVALDGTIIATNSAWTDFAENNDCDPDDVGVGINYINVCKKSAANGDNTAQYLVNLFEKVVSGEIKQISFKYPCHSPTTERWFKCTLTRLEDTENDIKVVIAHENITLIHKLKSESLKLEKLFSNLFNNSNSPILLIDTNGNITLANKQAISLFNWHDQAYSNYNLFNLFVDKSWASHPELEEIIRTCGSIRTTYETYPELNLQVEENNTIPVELNIYPIDPESSNIIAVTIIDISEKLNIQKQLRQSQTMEIIGRITGGVAHDYNNMIGIISGFAELLQLEKALPEKEASYVEQILNAAYRTSNLTKKLLAFSKSGEQAKELVNINNILSNDKDIFDTTATKNNNIIYRLDEKLWDTYINDTDFENAILNLVINATHAINENGSITISTSNEYITESPSVLFDIVEGEYVIVKIKDNGCGISKENIEKIFEPFFTTKEEKGTGLGLSQVYGFVKNSQGYIHVESKVGDGTQFTLYFPRYLAKEENNRQASKYNQVDSQLEFTENNSKILIVDDEKSFTELLGEFLSAKNYTVYKANSASAALEILKDTDVDLIITDIIMPNINGIQLSIEVEKLYPSVKILYISGYSDSLSESHEEKIRKGDVISKPFDFSDLLSKINSTLIKKD